MAGMTHPGEDRASSWGSSVRQPGAGAGRGQTDVRSGCWGQGRADQLADGYRGHPVARVIPLGFGFCVILRMELCTVSVSLICAHDWSRH